MPTERLGPWAERLAARHLELTGWTILARNYRVGRNEIDLVARRGEVVAFVEVKARRGEAMGHPLEAITPRKMAQIRKVAIGWILAEEPPGCSFRFDAIALTRGPAGEPVIEHVEDAWGI